MAADSASRRPVPPAARWWAIVAPFFPLICVALGGATARWAQGVALLILGVLLAAAPRGQRLGAMRWVFAALALLAAAAFLPERLFHQPAWRAGLEDDLAVQLPWTHTPQPWLTAESFAVFLAGLAWFGAVWTRPFSGSDARKSAQIFAAGAVVLAAIFIGLRLLGVNVPIWPTERHFGPFPNRNQTADFLAVASLLILGCARLHLRAGRPGRALWWMGGWLVVAWGVFLSFSRAGAVILVLGTGVYVILELRRSLRRNATGGKPAGMRRLAIGATAALALCSGVLLLGGDTLDRFRAASGPKTETLTTDFRLRIQRDAADLADSSPFFGVGLGNFSAIFPFYRERSALPARAIHPESDWLWMAAEMGWGAVIVALAGCVLIGCRMWPVRSEPERSLRGAAALAVSAFALHGLVDVSAHRLGTAACAIFIMGIALRPRRDEARVRFASPWIGRIVGVGLASVGLLWIIAETRMQPGWPGQQGVDCLKLRAQRALTRQDYASATRAVDQALAWAPLDWTLYFSRAMADLGLGRDEEAIVADFRRARYLEPFLGEAAITEAKLWLLAGRVGLGVNALAEACRREPLNTETYVSQAFASANPADLDFHAQMASLARTDPAIELPFYEQIVPPESTALIREAVRGDLDLKRFHADSQRTRFFRIWAQRGDIQALADAMARRPDWQRLGWRWWADARARAGAMQEACEIVQRFAAPPKLPPPPAHPRSDLRAAAAASPTNPALALELYYADPASAGATVRRIAAKPGSPRYFQWLDAQLSASEGDWPHAWQAWEHFLDAPP